LRVQATNWASSFEVTTAGVGAVGHAGAALVRELADRVGLTAALGWRDPQGRRHPDATVLRDLAVMLADGGDCLSDLAVLRDQPPCSARWPRPRPPGGWWNGSPATLTGWPGCGPLGRMPARAWAAGGDPDVELLIIDADATLVLAQTDAKEGAAGTYKGSFGFAPLLAYLDRGPAPGEPWPACSDPATPQPAPPGT
jgi:hypothetical protein